MNKDINKFSAAIRLEQHLDFALESARGKFLQVDQCMVLLILDANSLDQFIFFVRSVPSLVKYLEVAYDKPGKVMISYCDDREPHRCDEKCRSYSDLDDINNENLLKPKMLSAKKRRRKSRA